jgi:hypothetical protein
LTKKELEALFPPNKTTKSHILITRLRPGEQIHIKATAIKRTGKLNAAFSPVSLANFFFMESDKETKDNILDKQRNYIRNEYGDPISINFQIESINGLSYKYICPHPLINRLIVRFSLSTDDTQIYKQFFIDNCKEIIKIMEDLRAEWNKFSI